jgi:hypothetical protein
MAFVNSVGMGYTRHCVALTSGEGAVMAPAPSFGLGSDSFWFGGHHRRGRCSGLRLVRSAWSQTVRVVTAQQVRALLCLQSIVRQGLSQPLWWRARQVGALHCPLFARSALAQAATVLACTSYEGASQASVRFVDVGTASHCGGGHHM